MILKTVKLPRKLKKKVKKWFPATFPNHPSAKYWKRHFKIDEYTMSIYADCVAEKKDRLYNKGRIFNQN